MVADRRSLERRILSLVQARIERSEIPGALEAMGRVGLESGDFRDAILQNLSKKFSEADIP